MEVRSSTQKGVNRVNEDYLVCRELSDQSVLAILADGMGGLSHGDLAAHIVVDTIEEYIIANIKRLSSNELLREAIDLANDRIHTKCHELKCRMGASVAVLVIKDGNASYCWLGNIRIYAHHCYEELLLLTEDHTYCPDINNDSGYSYLTRCIKGKEFREDIPIQKISLNSGTHLILCTDGFYQKLSEIDILYLGMDAAYLHSSILDDCSVIEIVY